MKYLIHLSVLIMIDVACGSEFSDNVFRNLINLCPGQYVPSDINLLKNGTRPEESCCIDKFNETIEFNFPSNETVDRRSRQQCLFPQLRIEKFSLFQEARSYYMVTEAPEQGCVTTNTTWKPVTDILNYPTCNDSEIEFPLHQLLPVYSRSRRLIYKNPQCAQCHGIEDPENFEVLVYCKFNSDLSADTASCDFDFLFPGHEREIQHLECFTEKFSNCPQDLSPLILPNKFDLSIEELRHACSMENLPRFINYVYYAKNIFCFICHHNMGYDALGNQICSQQTESIFQKSLRKGTFARIIDVQTMTQSVQQGSAVSFRTEHVCGIDSDKEKCYPVLCPLGQIMIDDGKRRRCQMHSSLWIKPQFSLLLLLEFDEDIPVKGSLQETFKANAFSGLKSQSWTMDKIYIPFAKYTNMTHLRDSNKNFSGGQTLQSVRHIFTDLTFNELTIQPETFIIKLKDKLSEKWYFTASGRKVGLRKKLSRFSLWAVDATVPNLNLRMPLFVTADLTNEHAQTLERILYKLVTFNKKPTSELIITKLFLCQQVEIPTQSFFLYKIANSVVAIYHNYTRRTFFDREFVPSSYWLNIRICVSDFKTDFTSGTGRMSPMSFLSYMFIVIYSICY